MAPLLENELVDELRSWKGSEELAATWDTRAVIALLCSTRQRICLCWEIQFHLRHIVWTKTDPLRLQRGRHTSWRRHLFDQSGRS